MWALLSYLGIGVLEQVEGVRQYVPSSFFEYYSVGNRKFRKNVMRRILFLLAIAIVSLLSFLGCDDENKILSEEKNNPAATDSIPTADSVKISITLNCDSLSLYVDELDTLIATVRNGDKIIVDYKVTWSIDNASIAVVDSNGVVTALSVGTAVISATYQDVSYTCKIVVTGRPIVYEYVDLGLSVYWATFNVGATKPEEYGDYYAWGETETKTDYSWESYKWCNGSENTLTKYCNNSEYGYNGYTDDKSVLDSEDDVAHVKWGGNWRMPTRVEIEELTNNCSWTRENVGGVDGFKITGPNGNSIFIPAAGYYSGTEWIEAEYYENGHDGDFWSSTPGDDYKSYFVYFLTGTGGKGVAPYDRYRGWSVRPVCLSDAVSIVLNSDSKSLFIGSTYTLKATVKFNEEDLYREVVWTSADTSIATVSTIGLVKGVSAGSTTITASLEGKTVSCTITVIDESEIEHEYVDLGLSVKWASINVGAIKPEDYGEYFAWGELERKLFYSWENYSFCTGVNSYGNLNFTKYNTKSEYGTVDNDTILDPEDDVAHVKWGGSWRMPTKAEQDELVHNCTWEWYSRGNSEYGGVAGYKVTSKLEGYTDRFIFLPVAGYCYYFPEDAGVCGYYWSSSLGDDEQDFAFNLCFFEGNADIRSIPRIYGFSIRPVCP